MAVLLGSKQTVKHANGDISLIVNVFSCGRSSCGGPGERAKRDWSGRTQNEEKRRSVFLNSNGMLEGKQWLVKKDVNDFSWRNKKDK